MNTSIGVLIDYNTCFSLSHGNYFADFSKKVLKQLKPEVAFLSTFSSTDVEAKSTLKGPMA